MPYTPDFTVLSTYFDILLHGLGVTVGLTVGASVPGLIVALGLAVVLRAGGVAGAMGAAYVEMMRNTPFIIQMFFLFFGLPTAGRALGVPLRLSAPQAAALAMTLNFAAYGAEIFRAGLQSVAPGQREAAAALGLRRGTIFRRVVLPQALAAVHPALVSQMVITMLESAVVSQIGLADMTYAADFIQSRNFRMFETYFGITLAYLALAVLLRRAALWAFRRGLPAGAGAWSN